MLEAYARGVNAWIDLRIAKARLDRAIEAE